MNNVILKYKAKYPIGSILKHKKCDLMMRVLEYKFCSGYRNHCNVLCEEHVIIENIYSLVYKRCSLSIYYIDLLDQFKIITIDECNNILKEKGLPPYASV